MKRLLTIALLLTPALACAQNFPKMKEGLWTSATMTDAQKAKGQPGRSATICIDDATQKLLIQFSQGMMRGMCSKNDVRANGSIVLVDLVCDIMGSKIASKATMTFTGDTAYHTRTHSTYDPPLMGMKAGDTVVDGKYTGPCPAGMAAGDMQLPSGDKINLKSIAGGAPPK